MKRLALVVTTTPTWVGQTFLSDRCGQTGMFVLPVVLRGAPAIAADPGKDETNQHLWSPELTAVCVGEPDCALRFQHILDTSTVEIAPHTVRFICGRGFQFRRGFLWLLSLASKKVTPTRVFFRTFSSKEKVHQDVE